MPVLAAAARRLPRPPSGTADRTGGTAAVIVNRIGAFLAGSPTGPVPATAEWPPEPYPHGAGRPGKAGA